jgi:YYY domain-containing protein
MSWLPDSVRWYATLLVVAWAFAPLTRWLCGRLPDRGATVARPLGLIAVVWPTWFLASVTPLPFSTVGLWLTAAIGGITGWTVAVRRGWVTRDWLRAMLIAEAVTLVAFVAYVGLRGYTPRITGTEKPMDIAFLSASARATDLPPRDPWFAGETVNYYYLGYFVHGSLARMSDVPTWVAFNLALATTVAMTIVGAAGVAFNVGRNLLGRNAALAVGALAAFFVAVSGNLYATKVFLADPRGTIDHAWWPYPDDGGIGWKASRVVIDHGSSQAETINEFPWFSFLLGDLHPHVTGLPFTILALAIAVGLLTTKWRDEPDDRSRWGRLVVAGIAIGALYPLNSWDFPTYLVLAVAALVFASGWNRTALERAGVLVVAAVAAWLPFTVSFVPFAGGDKSELPSALRDLPLLSRLLTTVGIYTGERTSAGEFLMVFGIGWAAAIVYLTVAVVRATGRSGAPRVPGVVIASAVLVGLAAITLSAPVLILAGAPLAAAVWLLARRWGEPADAPTVVAGLFAAGFALILITEFFYIQDVFQGRYNTLFKVYYQVWMMFGVAAALAVGLLWRQANAAGRWVAPRAALAGGVAVAVAAGAVYPGIATRQWLDWAGPREWQGLDGLAFVGETAPGDVATIHWLAEHANEDDVVLEGAGCQYRVNFGVPTSRISAFTGVPTIIGWDGAEGQWRKGQPDLEGQIERRAEDVTSMYASPQGELFDRYGVTLLYVGIFERDGTGDECTKAGPFEAVNRPDYPGAGWTEVFSSDGGTLYRHDPGS